MLKAFLYTSLFVLGIFVLLPSCGKNAASYGVNGAEGFADNLIDSSLTHNVIYVYDEVYSLETLYYDYQKQLVKTVKYDDIVRCVIYNVQSKDAMKLKSIELATK